MKRNRFIFIVVCVVAFVCVMTQSCANGGGTESKSDKIEKPINITVFLDLSDRLVRELTPTQMDRDTAIIRCVGDYFVNACIQNQQLLKSKNCFQVLFYPTPNSSEINIYARKLNLNLSDMDPNNKKKALLDFKNSLATTTSALYDEVLKSKNWTGCDIWRFFSDKKVDQYCIRKGYRNILIILTDGYLYETNDKVKEGSAYSYILPQTLKIADSSLIVRRKGLQDLEVLMLEINPYDVKDKDKMISVLQTWFNEMQVHSFVVADTDLPNNTKHIISNFLNSSGNSNSN